MMGPEPSEGARSRLGLERGSYQGRQPRPVAVEWSRTLPGRRSCSPSCIALACGGEAATGRIQKCVPEKRFPPVPNLMRALLSRAADRFARTATLRIRPDRLADLEERLRVQQALLEELFRSAPEGIVVVDENDNVLRVNEEFSHMFGFTPEEALGRPINELIVPDHLKEEGLTVTRGVVTGARILVETQRRRKDGTLIEVSVLATPIQVAGGPIGAYGIYRDITERKQHERALRESEARYRALFEQSPVGVFTCDAALVITECNERLPRILGTQAPRLVGTNLRTLPASDIFFSDNDRISREPIASEGAYQPPDGGETRWLSARYAPLRDTDGDVIGGIGVVEDATDRERAEQRLRAQAAELERVNAELRERTLELESAMRVRSRLYSSINHELRTPISAISLYHELLLSGALGEMAPAHREALEQSQTATLHLLDLVGDVLDLSKLEAGSVTVNLVPVSIPELLTELRATALPLARRHDTDLVLELDPHCDRWVTDPQRLRQILLNLISNASKFGRGHPVRLRCTIQEGAMVIEVVDQGVGIAAQDLENVFEDFVQVGNQRESGAGLGLAICRRLSDLLGATLEVESEPDIGSVFRLTMPHPAEMHTHGRSSAAPA
jgi:PAS domain S-box-containing protein